MSRIRGRDTVPELKVRRFLHRRGFRYRLHVRALPSTPDLVLPRHRAVILVHGCFWHRHPGCRYAYVPKSRREFWASKFERTIERDRRDRQSLESLGWRVATVWECELDDDHLAELVHWLAT